MSFNIHYAEARWNSNETDELFNELQGTGDGDGEREGEWFQ